MSSFNHSLSLCRNTESLFTMYVHLTSFIGCVFSGPPRYKGIVGTRKVWEIYVVDDNRGSADVDILTATNESQNPTLNGYQVDYFLNGRKQVSSDNIDYGDAGSCGSGGGDDTFKISVMIGGKILKSGRELLIDLPGIAPPPVKLPIPKEKKKSD